MFFLPDNLNAIDTFERAFKTHTVNMALILSLPFLIIIFFPSELSLNVFVVLLLF